MPILDPTDYQAAFGKAILETSTIDSWRKLTNINSFATKLLNTGIPAITSLMPKADYHNYSGVNPEEHSNYLGKFFQLARFVDGDSSTTRKKFFTDTYLNLDGSAISAGPFGTTIAAQTPKVEFDQKPWSQDWSGVGAHIKAYMIGKWNPNVALSQSISQNISDPIFKDKTNKPTVPTAIESWYNAAPQTSDSNGKFSRLDLLKCIAGSGTSNPIIQRQVNGELFIRGYLMNQLVVESPPGSAAHYFGGAIANKLGLLSGPSGTTKRFWGLVSNLVRTGATKPIDPTFETNIKVFSAALCACALSSPYDNHSFYEIITVIDPEDKLECAGSLTDFNSKYFTRLNASAPDCFPILDAAISNWSHTYKWGPGSGTDCCQIKK
ncbi:MAG: hypothetical protein KTR23_18150 [Rhodospirillales bacterium]|nr:hypothetical protein [Rhodospirillales bacterium]